MGVIGIMRDLKQHQDRAVTIGMLQGEKSIENGQKRAVIYGSKA